MLDCWTVGFGSVPSLLPFLLSVYRSVEWMFGDGLNLNTMRLGDGLSLPFDTSW